MLAWMCFSNNDVVSNFLTKEISEIETVDFIFVHLIGLLIEWKDALV